MMHAVRLSFVKRYISLTKPGVLLGNVITGIAGFGCASAVAHSFNLGLFAATIVGMTLIIASACVLNNVLDRDIDQLMARTARRAVASRLISPPRALAFAVLLGIAGLLLLIVQTSWLVVAIGVAGFVVYVWLYGAVAKRRSLHGTLVGSVSGAAPILAGYVAVRGQVDAGAVLVFLALFFWQFPEFYSIAIYRRAEYAAAKIPIITVVKDVEYTKRRIIPYTLLCITSMLLLTPLGYTGRVYLLAMALAATGWLWTAAQGFRASTDAANDAWARQMFHASINLILFYSLMIMAGPLLP